MDLSKRLTEWAGRLRSQAVEFDDLAYMHGDITPGELDSAIDELQSMAAEMQEIYDEEFADDNPDASVEED